jgi:hypothetical protein
VNYSILYLILSCLCLQVLRNVVSFSSSTPCAVSFKILSLWTHSGDTLERQRTPSWPWRICKAIGRGPETEECGKLLGDHPENTLLVPVPASGEASYDIGFDSVALLIRHVVRFVGTVVTS